MLLQNLLIVVLSFIKRKAKLGTAKGDTYPDITWFSRAISNSVQGSPATELEQLLRDKTEKFIEHVALTFTMVTRALATPSGSLLAADLQCLGLIWSGLNLLIAAQSLLLRGFYNEALILSRTSFENLAVSMYLHDNPDESERFKEGKIDGKDCITHVKNKLIPSFGKQYGMLSEFVHQKPWYTLSFLVPDAEEAIYYVVGGTFIPEHADRSKFCALYVGLLAFHYCWFAELLLFYTKSASWRYGFSNNILQAHTCQNQTNHY